MTSPGRYASVKRQASPQRLIGKVPSMLGVARSSKHMASQPGHPHRPDAGADNALARAQIWSHVTGRPLPPHMREREPLSPPVPMKLSRRPVRTAAQRQRARHKTGHLLARTRPSSATYGHLRETYRLLAPWRRG